MKKTLFVTLCIFCLVAFSSSAFAARGWRAGKKTYKSVCMSCHKRGGEAQRLKLNQWSKAKWTKYFAEEKKGKHEGPWGQLTDEEKDNLLKYFHKYAKDDHTRLGCG
ncbi:cytochrome c [uncultured Desulfuromonas sp.]|uniref:c-type cytochrome n=1 Tax=uncultured Desulfuromonas sp. TaxID=181013 RepID=UPI002AAB7F2F|nr:cytochrome c [uncultured Desulfuromonas sp.]